MAKAFSLLRGLELGLDDILGFGRHQGYTVNEILKDRPEYICWLIDNTDIKFYPSVHQIVDKIFPPTDTWTVPKDIAYWQETDHWNDDIPF